VNLDAIHDGADAASVRHGNVLVEFAAALVNDPARLPEAREALVAAAGPAAAVEAAAVAANFQRMVRIADGTGIGLGEGLQRASAQTRAELDLERFRRD
jgi:hypothetical protein